MQNKALEIISSFIKPELNEFTKFISSPYFNNNSKVIEYYHAIIKDEVNEEAIFSRLYPKEKFRSDRIRKLSSELYKLAQSYLSHKAFASDTTTQKRYLLKELSERRLDNIFELKYDTIKKNTLNEALNNSVELHSLFETENIFVNFHLERNQQSKTAEAVLKRGEYLITYFLLMLFKSIDDMESNESAYNVKYEDSLLYEFNKNFNAEGMLEYFKKHEIIHSHSLQIFYALFKAWREFENEGLYFAAKELVEKHLDKLNIQDKESVLLIMMNYCIKKFYYTQNTVFNHEKFNIYIVYLKNEIYKNSKYLGQTVYMNILKLAVMIHEFEWAKDFVDKYVVYFIKDEADIVKHFSYSIIAFHSKDYKLSLSEAAKVTAGINEMGDKIGLRTYIICSHYELGNYDAAYEELRNFKVFLKKNNISPYFRTPAINYSKALTKLLSYNFSNRKHRTKADLKNYISELGIMNFQGWVLAKVNELE